MLAKILTRFLVKRQERKLCCNRSFHQVHPQRNESNQSPLLSPNLETSGVQRSSQMWKRLCLSFQPRSRADFPSRNCLHHTTTRCCNLLKVLKDCGPQWTKVPAGRPYFHCAWTQKDRYLELLSNCRCNGWTAFHLPVEFGLRGFVAFSLTCLQKLGFPSYLAKKARNECSKIALCASYSISLQKNIREWFGR